ncbi:MAG: hypothetical protein H0W50_11590 [Parachlamydiaceae bacterium]|nr:hypothetical protein [Parachlamydiaceae bacterium]
MSFNFVAGFQATVQIKDVDDNLISKRFFSSPEEITAFIRDNGKSKMVGHYCLVSSAH